MSILIIPIAFQIISFPPIKLRFFFSLSLRRKVMSNLPWGTSAPPCHVFYINYHNLGYIICANLRCHLKDPIKSFNLICILTTWNIKMLTKIKKHIKKIFCQCHGSTLSDYQFKIQFTEENWCCQYVLSTEDCRWCENTAINLITRRLLGLYECAIL